MNSKKLFAVLKVLLSLGLALLLFWYLYKDGFSDTLERMKQVNYSWVVLSLVIGIAAHLVRAFRWKLLLQPTGNDPSVGRSLMALLIGYMVNLVVPRLGEISRCLVLKRTNNIPVTSSLGTVVSERVLDVLCLLVITGITLIIEFEQLNEFFSSFFMDKLSGLYTTLRKFIWLLLAIPLLLAIVWFVLHNRLKKSSWWIKLRTLLRQTWLGFISITQLKNPWAFWLSTLIIWVLYYFMSYVVIFAMEPTAHLGWRAGLALLVMGGLGMSAPVQGGIGAFHLLVAGLLIYYQVSKADGLSFAFLLHSTQLVLVLVAGIISALAIFYIERKTLDPSQSVQLEE